MDTLGSGDDLPGTFLYNFPLVNPYFLVYYKEDISPHSVEGSIDYKNIKRI